MGNGNEYRYSYRYFAQRVFEDCIVTDFLNNLVTVTSYFFKMTSNGNELFFKNNFPNFVYTHITEYICCLLLLNYEII